MTAMTLDHPDTMGRDDTDELRQAHLRKLADIFDGTHGAERALRANAYAALLAELELDARAIRNVEVARIVDKGAGPAEIGRLFGVVRQRGDQIIKAATPPDRRPVNEQRVRGLRARLGEWRRDA